MKLLIVIVNSEGVWIAKLFNILHIFNKTFLPMYNTPDYD